MTIRPDQIEEIKSRTSIVELVAEYIPIKQVGTRQAALCPFHHEKTPSFSINHAGQFFYCFGCKASGDIFDFIMRMEGLDFPGAATFLAERAGIELQALSPDEARRESIRKDLLRLNQLASEIYRRALIAEKLGQPARNYLQSRGLDARACERFSLGYAPAGGKALVEILRRQGIGLEDAASIGLVLPSENGYADRFRDRLIFPLIDLKGHILGFGGRILGNGQPKYLNSSESVLFNKGRFLYGLYIARDSIRQTGQAVLVEGYLDAISLQMAGINNVVAVMGTALTEHHTGLLKRYTTQVVIAFDGDTAGQSATVRGIDHLRQAGLDVRILLPPSGMDPDDIVNREGRSYFEGLISAAVPFTEFLLVRAIEHVNLDSPEGRALAVKNCLPVLAEVAAGSARDGYLHKIARQILVHEDRIETALKNYLQHMRKEPHKLDNDYKDSNNKCYDAQSKDAGLNPPEKEVLRAILKEYSLLTRIKDELGPEDFDPGPFREIYTLLIGYDEPFDPSQLPSKIPAEYRALLIELLAVTGEVMPPITHESLHKSIRRIKAKTISRQLLEVEAELERVQGDKTKEHLVSNYQRRQLDLRRQLESYRSYSGFA